MATHGEWIENSARVGAWLVGVPGFVYATYETATYSHLHWTGVGAVMDLFFVLVFATLVCCFFVIAGWLAGLVLGAISLPLSSFTEKH
jgi:hypothetical protein